MYFQNSVSRTTLPRNGLRTRTTVFGSLLLLISLLMMTVPASAMIEVYEFKDEVTRQRYQSFLEEMRCPKCQNQNLDGSDSPIAADLRREIYIMLDDGKSDKEIVDFMVSRYGEYVLYRPKMATNTLLLWGLPAVLLLLGGVMIVLTLRQRDKTKALPDPLVADEQARLQRLLEAAAHQRQQQERRQRQD
jgi:cytochrome c-type biogenesis protein CcmH